jgi:hypothetical protein
MGSTFVEFRDRGFEASDSTLEIWLLLLVDAIDELPNYPDWLKEVREEWYVQATESFGAGVMPGLDAVVTDSDRLEMIIDLCSKAMKRMHGYGPTISKDVLNGIRKNEGTIFTEDVPTELFERVGDYFTRLLRGVLKPEECDARFPPRPRNA